MEKIKLKDPHLILCCAFRYALGRRTYVVSAVVDEIINNWNEISIHDKERFRKEILEYLELNGELGHECDKQEWFRIINKEN